MFYFLCGIYVGFFIIALVTRDPSPGSDHIHFGE